MTSFIQLDKIKTDGGTQSRACINPLVVEEYAAIIREGTDFPPVTVFYDGKRYWLADGFHRLAAYRTAGAVEIAAAIHQGTKRDAVLFSVGANADHGLRRTDDDKKRAVFVLLKDKEWGAWSDRQIARQCGVSHPFVAKVRFDLTGNVSSDKRQFVTKHGTVATMDTSKIGKPETVPDEQADFDRQRQAVADSLPDDIKAMEAAKAERRAPVRDSADDDSDDIEELRNIIATQQEEVADLRREVAKYDGMVVEYERGGFENVIAGLNQRIENLQRQVERESREKLQNLRAADYWKKKAIEAGANADIVIDLETGETSRG